MYLTFLILLAYSFPTFSVNCESPPNCAASPSNYTLSLNISSDVLAPDGNLNYVLKNNTVKFVATAHLNDKSPENFTDFIKQSMFCFKYRYISGSENNWTVIECVNETSSAALNHSWSREGRIECIVELMTLDNKSLACNSTLIQIAVNDLACLVETKTFQENHDTSKLAYSIGNITFTSTMALNWDFTKYFLLYYSFGDNTSDTVRIENRTRSTNYTHNYTNVCNKCNYGVTLISVLLFGNYTHYCKFDDFISVIKPVTPNNSNIIVNSGKKKLYKKRAAKLEVSTEATLPLTVCWSLYGATERHNGSNGCPLSKSNKTECQNVTNHSSFNHYLSFPDAGTYTLMTSFDNNADCTTKNYTLEVDTLGVSAGAVAGEVIGIIVFCSVLVLLILLVFIYIQYRRYKNKHIETAKFNFVVLPLINTDSRWARFTMACRRKWYKITGRRFKEGLVTTLNASGQYTCNDSCTNTISYGTLLQAEHSESYKDNQFSLHDYVSSGYHGDEHDDR